MCVPTENPNPDTKKLNVIALQAHNKYRTIHGTPLLVLNNEMSKSATAYAEMLAQGGKLKYSAKDTRNGQGENIAMSCNEGSSNKVAEIEDMIK